MFLLQALQHCGEISLFICVCVLSRHVHLVALFNCTLVDFILLVEFSFFVFLGTFFDFCGGIHRNDYYSLINTMRQSFFKARTVLYYIELNVHDVSCLASHLNVCLCMVALFCTDCIAYSLLCFVLFLIFSMFLLCNFREEYASFSFL